MCRQSVGRVSPGYRGRWLRDIAAAARRSTRRAARKRGSANRRTTSPAGSSASRCSCFGALDEPVANAADGLDELRRKGIVDLAAQVADVHVDNVRQSLEALRSE